MKRAEHKNRVWRPSEYLAIPHELLHVIGYRLAGQQCQYQWGNFYVTPLGPMPLRAQLVGMLFPFVVFSALCFVFGILSGLAYSHALRNGSFFWFIFLTGLALVTGGYAGTSIGDLRQAYLLIFNKPWYSWTPFDIFFWPTIDWSEVRRKVAMRKTNDEQS